MLSGCKKVDGDSAKFCAIDVERSRKVQGLWAHPNRIVAKAKEAKGIESKTSIS